MTAIAWRNHPPEDDTPATVLGAVANLDRVRAGKCGARDAGTVARHERALATARRRAERAAATAGTAGARSPNDNGQDLPGDADHLAPTSAQCRPPVGTTPTPNQPPQLSDPPENLAGGSKVPARAATLTRWARV